MCSEIKLLIPLLSFYCEISGSHCLTWRKKDSTHFSPKIFSQIQVNKKTLDRRLFLNKFCVVQNRIWLGCFPNNQWGQASTWTGCKPNWNINIFIQSGLASATSLFREEDGLVIICGVTSLWYSNQASNSGGRHDLNFCKSSCEHLLLFSLLEQD